MIEKLLTLPPNKEKWRHQNGSIAVQQDGARDCNEQDGMDSIAASALGLLNV
jgi:hypothetical protein